MTTTKTTDSHSLQNALGHLESIRDLMRRIEDTRDDEDAHDALVTEATNSALSVEFRSDWNPVGTLGKDVEMTEYRILLSTGGPACQITGTLGAHGEPETAILEHQDWGTPWMPVQDYDIHRHLGATGESADSTVPPAREDLLAFARLFYFGE